MSGNIFLVGLMGAGKTTVGRAIAKLLDKTFVDADHEIEAQTGVRIPTIFDIEGEVGFRAREADVISRLVTQQNLVLATGGGAVLHPDTRTLLRQHGYVIYLRANVEDLYQRTRLDRNRPLLQTADPKARLEALYVVRDPLYREVAHLIVDTSKQSVQNLAQKIVTDLMRDANYPRSA
ncbi:shikimate kinase [Burkholderiaceae bacterium DAT-1]|nr:shikimate kinase [Burkholderiaceae bacterium DAT-1]